MRVGFCRDCRFFSQNQPAGRGECRRNAPVAFTSQYTRAVAPLAAFARWPIVESSDGCGEFSKGSIPDPTRERK